MSAEGKVSPLPWRIENGDIVDAEGGLVVDTEWGTEPTELIVRAVNSHAQLVEAIERFLAAAEDSCDASPDHDDVRAMLEYGDSEKALRAALAAAKEGA